MTDQLNNPPVHPVYDDPTETNVLKLRSHGMTLLDHFAGLAMQGQIAHSDMFIYDDVAERAYYIAEAMLREKQRREAT